MNNLLKLITVLLTLLFSLLTAQNQRFTYQYQFAPDSTNLKDVKTEWMNLDVSPKGSVFYSYEVYKSDSLMKADLERQLAATGAINVKADMKKGSFKALIYKDYPDFEVEEETSLKGKGVRFKDNRDLVWKILNETDKIGEWTVQKAETSFAGRKWVAWFTAEIPIQDGPYKFNGLPGLIVKMEDANKTHIFLLTAVTANFTPFDPKLTFRNKPLLITREQYLKQFKEDRIDPVAGLRQMLSTGAISNMHDSNGNAINASEMLRKRERQAREQQKKNNNILELDLLK